MGLPSGLNLNPGGLVQSRIYRFTKDKDSSKLPICRAPEGSSILLTITGRITVDKAECPEYYIQIIDPYSLDTFSTAGNYTHGLGNVVNNQWKLCPASADGEKTIFQSFLNVIKIREKTGPVLDNSLVFQANYSVMKENNLARKMSFIKSHFRESSCTEVRVSRMKGWVNHYRVTRVDT